MWKNLLGDLGFLGLSMFPFMSGLSIIENEGGGKKEEENENEEENQDEEKNKDEEDSFNYEDLSEAENDILKDLEEEEENLHKEEEKKDDENEDGDDEDKKDKKGEDENESKDERGVPYKQKVAEMERKNRELKEQLDELNLKVAGIVTGGDKGNAGKGQPKVTREEVVKKILTQYPNMGEDQVNASVDLVTDIASGMMRNVNQSILPTTASVEINKAKSAAYAKNKEFFEKYGDEFDDIINRIPIEVKAHPQGAREAVENAILIVKGKNTPTEEDIQERVRKEVEKASKKFNKRIVDNDAGSDRVSGNRGKGSVNLTNAQRREAQELGMTDTYYQYTLKKRQEKAKSRGETIPQSLA